ncbi:hypothetical protein BRAS3843_1480025 [Bradyrhizobium sp. STM 3843]|nr:hypothetical protein BRAS3843_1480025 [Bradyrhizobium sp. STM 3843]
MATADLRCFELAANFDNQGSIGSQASVVPRTSSSRNCKRQQSRTSTFIWAVRLPESLKSPKAYREGDRVLEWGRFAYVSTSGIKILAARLK